MHFLSRCFLAFFVLLATPLHAAGDKDWLYRGSDIPRDPAWTFGTLTNGVRYAVRQNKLPVGQVSIRVHVDVGSLHEEDHQRGWAHLIEHLAFRGTASFGDREARHIWQQLGASFGSDTNASTSPTRTVYQLDLPDADLDEVDQSLQVISEMVDSALFDPASVAAEQKIVLAEKGRRSEIATKMMETSWPLFYAGLRLEDRDTIGTEATLSAARSETLRAFYERWYRPDRATIVVAGDADPKALEALIAKRFGGWQGSGPAPEDPDFGTIRTLEERTAALAYPGAPSAATVMWLRPYADLPNTKEREKTDLARSLAVRILNRRLEAKARGEASFVSAGATESRQRNIADLTQLSITAREGKWREALSETFAILKDALQRPPSPAEIERELKNLHMSATSAVEAEPTVKSQQWAQHLVNAIDSGTVVAAASTQLSLLDELSPQMTPEAVEAGMREILSGAGPRMVLLSATPIPADTVKAALASAEKAAPAERQADRIVSMDRLPPLGPEGREVSRERIEDLGVTIVRFANGSTLTFKQTDFEKGSVAVQLRFGEGLAGLDPGRPSLAWLGSLVGPSGLADLDLDALERLLTGRRMSMSFAVDEDAFVLRGTTNGTDLSDQLRLMATKLDFPRWDAQLFERQKAAALESYELSFVSASARMGREFGAFTRPDDKRWDPVEKAAIEKVTLEDFRTYFTPLLAGGPVQAIIVGDVDLETAVLAMRKSIAALPDRKMTPTPASFRDVHPPKPDPKPVSFTHKGDPAQAYAVIGWNTFGGTRLVKERRALSVAANMLQVRLFDSLREEEGASYSPNAVAASSDTFEKWGIFYAASELRPASVDTFFRIARETVADLAAKAAAPDEFQRAQNPIVSGIDRRLKTNGYWLTAMEDWVTHPEFIEYTRNFRSDYATMTAEDVRAAVARHVMDGGDWSMLVLPDKAPGGGN